MESSKVHFIVNPWAGKKSVRSEEAILEYARRHSLHWQIDICSERYGIKEMTRKALEAGASCIVSVGGDGTLHEVAGVMMNSGAALGVLPVGTGNDFARSTNMPTDIEKALDVIQAQKRKFVDMGSVNGEPFINISSAGFAADVNVNLKSFKRMRLHGIFAYLASTIRTAASLNKVEADIELFGVQEVPESGPFEFKDYIEKVGESFGENESETLYRVKAHRFLLIAACNGRFFGGGMCVAPFALIDDGLFDICLVHDITRRDMALLLPGFLKGKHVEKKRICAYFRAKGFRIVLNKAINVELDGEVRSLNDIKVRIHPKALEIIVK